MSDKAITRRIIGLWLVSQALAVAVVIYFRLQVNLMQSISIVNILWTIGILCASMRLSRSIDKKMQRIAALRREVER